MSKNRVPHRKQYIDGRLQDPPCNLKRKTQCRKRSKPTFTHGFAFGNALRPAYQISQAWLNEAKTPAQWKHSLCCPTWTVALCYDTSCSVVMLCYMILVCCVVIHIIFRSRVVCCVLVHAMFCFVRYNEEGWAERWRRLQQVSIRKSQGGTGGGGGEGGEQKEKPGSHKDKPGSHKESNPQHKKKYHAHIWGNLEHKRRTHEHKKPTVSATGWRHGGRWRRGGGQHKN